MPVGTNQLHDYEPGIAPTGLFWTIRVPRQVVKVNLARAVASLRMTDVPMPDFHDFGNGVVGGKSEPARVSFDVRWSGAIKRLTVRNDAQAFTGEFIQDNATIVWSAQQAGFSFQSDPDPKPDMIAQIGREQSGALRLRDVDEDDDPDV